MKKDTPEDLVLKRIRYGSSGGSMAHHSEFEIEADADEIIRTAYYSDCPFSPEEEDLPSETDADEMTVKEHIPMDKALWQALAEEIGYLKEQLRPVENRKPLPFPAPDMFVLDGGDYQRLYLTWETDKGEDTVQYYPPSGNRWTSVIAIIREMARPVGRDLHRIGETRMTAFFLKTPKYSYQITPVQNTESFYFFVHGDSADTNRLTREQWNTVREFLEGIDISGYKRGKYESKYYLRLNYNDGINKELEISKKTAELIRAFIRKNILTAKQRRNT